MTSILAASTAAADDVAASVAARLRDSGQLEDYRVNVKESEGTVFLEGEVTDARQIAAALAVAENTEGVERVVNRLSLKTAKKRSGITLSLPASMRKMLGVEPESTALTVEAGEEASPQFVAAGQDDADMLAGPLEETGASGEIELVNADAALVESPAVELDVRPLIEPAAEAVVAAPVEAAPVEAALVEAGPVDAAPAVEAEPVAEMLPEMPAQPESAVALVEAAPEAVTQPLPEVVASPPTAVQTPRSNTPRPMAMARASAIPTQPDMSRTEHAATKRPATITSWVKQVAGVMNNGERVVPGSERVTGDYGPGEYVPTPAPQNGYYADQGAPQQMPAHHHGGGLGRPMPMGAAGVGMPPVPMRGDGPNMPNYAWPSYASYPNYAALQYPTQYSPTAWPYIGPFYPYPQVPLGWRRVSLEWDDGWWFLDFDDRAQHH
jgi:hypothetical protein